MPALTADDIAAFRKADVVVVHRISGTPEKGPKNFIRLTQKVYPKATKGFTAEPVEVERIVEIDNDMVTVRSYEDRGPDPTCVDVDLHAGMHDSVWRTIAQVMRPGNEISLLWMAGNNSPVLQDHGLTRDELWLSIYWRGRDGQISSGKEFRFLVSVFVGLDNSARMITRGR